MDAPCRWTKRYLCNEPLAYSWLAGSHARSRSRQAAVVSSIRQSVSCTTPSPFFFYQSSFDFVHVPTIYSNWFSLLIHGRIGYFPPILFDNGNLWKIVNIVTRVKKQSNYFIANFYLLEKVIQKWLYQNLIKISE